MWSSNLGKITFGSKDQQNEVEYANSLFDYIDNISALIDLKVAWKAGEIPNYCSRSLEVQALNSYKTD